MVQPLKLSYTPAGMTGFRDAEPNLENEEPIELKVALRFSGVNFVSLNFIDYVSMALCMGDNRVGDTSDLLDLPQEMGLARRGSS